jgi:hypothetical protein
MRRLHYAAVLIGICLLFSASTLDGSEPLRMRVSPLVAMAPGFLTVRVSVEAAAENRILQVVAESPDFYRSSQIQLDGAQAAPIAVFEFRNLPSGLYQVTGVLVGVNGPRATVSGLAKVQPSPGR